METEQAKFEGWAIVEMMGHQQEIGYVTTEAYGLAVLFRIDIPEIPGHELILKRPEYGSMPGNIEESRYLPVGTKVQRQGTPARSRLVSPAALYAINPCTQEAAITTLKAKSLRPLICIELPEERQLGLPSISPAAVPGSDQDACEECGAVYGEDHADRCFHWDGEQSHTGDIPEGDAV